jgi:hypothetical protein
MCDYVFVRKTMFLCNLDRLRFDYVILLLNRRNSVQFWVRNDYGLFFTKLHLLHINTAINAVLIYQYSVS